MQSNDSPGWEYHPDGQEPLAPAQPEQNPPVGNDLARQNPAVDNTGDDITWTAGEYIHHEKGVTWYILLFIGALVVSGLLYLITKDMISSVIIMILAIVVAVFASRKPGQVEYRVGASGISVGGRLYKYSVFKSFSIIQDEGVHSILLSPLKRLMPPITIYFAPEDEDSIKKLLGNYLPMEAGGPEAIDRLARRLRF